MDGLVPRGYRVHRPSHLLEAADNDAQRTLVHIDTLKIVFMSDEIKCRRSVGRSQKAS